MSFVDEYYIRRFLDQPGTIARIINVMRSCIIQYQYECMKFSAKYIVIKVAIYGVPVGVHREEIRDIT